MRRAIAGVFLAAMMLPQLGFAEGAPVTRRDGFLMLWNSIRRAIIDNREKPFADVPEGAKGFDEITYAKYRGIVDDDDVNFYPDTPLTVSDALLWLFRTRSVDDIEELTTENIPSLLERYPLRNSSNDTLTEEELLTLMRLLDEKLMTEDHEVSLYSEKFHGDGTAFGESFDMHAMTAAHRTFPYNTLVRVTNVRNGKSVTVRINDRGPYVDGRDMDLSLAAFTSIEDRSRGILRATFQRLGDANLVSQCPADDAGAPRQQRIAGFTRLIGGIPQTLKLGESLTLRSTRAFVVRGVRYPDGTVNAVEDWVLPDEKYSITPSIEGEYVFTLGTVNGRRRDMRMTVVQCD